MNDAELLQLPPCELAKLWPIEIVERVFKLGYDPETKCDDFKKHDCFFNHWSSSWADDERDTSFIYAFYLRKSWLVGYTEQQIINILEFIKRHSKRLIVIIPWFDDIRNSYSRKDYLILKPCQTFLFLGEHIWYFIPSNPIFMYCYENGFFIAKSSFIQRKIGIFRDESAKIKKCTHNPRKYGDCCLCIANREYEDFELLMDNLTRKQTSLFELLLNKLYF